MRKQLLLLVFVSCLLSSCGLYYRVFGSREPKKGCPTNGKNIGAEKLAAGDPQAMKAARKAKKFKV
ncbi:MAG: hypothetical protein K2Y12_10770 [Chitinophagaceae bacterium]|nr:hypothetical protein [Chitinophagaceae bacterium]